MREVVGYLGLAILVVAAGYGTYCADAKDKERELHVAAVESDLQDARCEVKRLTSIMTAVAGNMDEAAENVMKDEITKEQAQFAFQFYAKWLRLELHQ